MTKKEMEQALKESVSLETLKANREALQDNIKHFQAQLAYNEHLIAVIEKARSE